MSERLFNTKSLAALEGDDFSKESQKQGVHGEMQGQRALLSLSETLNPVEETTVMSQGAVSMWHCWESKNCSCSKTAGLVVTGVPTRSGFGYTWITTKGANSGWRPGKEKTSVLISSNGSSCQDI